MTLPEQIQLIRSTCLNKIVKLTGPNRGGFDIYDETPHEVQILNRIEVLVGDMLSEIKTLKKDQSLTNNPTSWTQKR